MQRGIRRRNWVVGMRGKFRSFGGIVVRREKFRGFEAFGGAERDGGGDFRRWGRVRRERRRGMIRGGR